MALKAEEAREFKVKARMMYFSNEVIDRFCATATPGQLAAAVAMLDDEQGVRERRKRDRLFRKAKFPQVKSFEGYDFSQVSFPEGYTAEDLMGLGFIDRAQDFVFYGQTGRGKTHLAIAIGVAAASSGKAVRLFTTAELVMALTMASSAGTLDQFMRDLAKADLLILDEFGYVPFPEGYTAEDLMGLGFIDRAQDFVFYGQTGRGKTHLAIAIGVAAASSGKAVRFFTTAELVMALTMASSAGALDQFMRDLAKADLLILDEFGYVPLDINGARLLFQVVSACYEKRSVVFTTNIEFSKWGTILGDDKLASAMIDRVVHHGRLVEFNGTSKRMDKALMLGKAEI